MGEVAPGMTGRLGALVVLNATLLLLGLPAGACQPASIDRLLPTASQPRVSAVVEQVVVARNPLPWGRSVSVVTRVWGDVMVERWVVSDRRSHPCPDVRAEPPGSAFYTFPASGGLVEVAAEAPVAGLVGAGLDARFGPPSVMEVSGMDRVMAWVRVFPTLTGLALAAGAGGTGLLVRRRRRRRDPYLF